MFLMGVVFFSSCKKEPLEIVEKYSCLSMPSSAVVNNFVDFENERGEKVLFVDVSLTKENMEHLTMDISKKDYKKLPIDDEIVTPEQNGSVIVKYLSKRMQNKFFIPNRSSQHFDGYYKIKKSESTRDFEIVIIDKSSERVIVYALSI